MAQFRWGNSVLLGNWCATEDAALRDALSSGQADHGPETDGPIILKDFASMQKRLAPPLAA